MKASRDGGKQKVEPAVLFPRLHVSDTEKAGPRAPPRNKMALYEQFTIPSNRLLPPSLPLPRSSRAAPYSQQYISAEYGYPCTPYYLQPTLAYRRADANSYSFHPPCMGISVNGAVTYGDSEFPRVPRMQSTLKSEVSRQGAKSAAAHGTRSQEKPPGKKSRADDDNRVPVFSTQNPAVKCLQKSSEVRGRHSSSAAKSSATIPSSNTVDSHAELTEHSRDRSEMVPGIRESISGSHHRKHLDDHTCNMQEEQICSRNATSQSVVFERQSSLHPQVKQKYTCENIISQQLNKETCAASLNTGTLSQCTDAGESMCGTQDNLLVDRNNKLGEDCNKIKSGVAAKLYTSKQYSQVPKESIEKAGQNIECILEHPSTGNGFESTGESENISHGSGEVLEPSQPGDRSGSDDSDLSMLDSSSAPKILPRDLMKLVGQWQFWKARKTIIRQQQLFSDQVFELHKLIQVQRMLAETPDSVPDDNMYCDPASDTDKCILGASNDSVDQAKRKSVNYSAAAAAAKDTTGYVLGQGPYSKNDYCPSLFNGNSTLNYDPYGHMYLTPIPSSPAAMPGGVVWGYPCPSIGIPIAETPSSGSLGSNQLAELPYNSHQKQVSVPVGQQSQSAIFDNHEQTLVTPDSSTLLHSGMAYSFHSLQGMAATPSTLSVANQNKCEKSVEQITPANVSYESQWVSRITGQSGCKGYKSPISQAQHTNISISSGTCTSNVVSPSPILDGHMSGQHAEEPYVPGQNVEIVGHTYDVDRSHNTSEGALERGSKRCRKVFGGLDESKVPDDGESDEGNSDHFGNALPLFPLSPGTNSSFQGRLTTQAEGQGRVIRITPRAAVAAPKSAAGILLSIQQERAR